MSNTNPITYKSVIWKAINDFNSIQRALMGKQAKYNDKIITDPTATDGSPIPTADLSTIITNQLQLIPSGESILTLGGSNQAPDYSMDQNGIYYYTFKENVSNYSFVRINEASQFTLSGPTDDSTKPNTAKTLTKIEYISSETPYFQVSGKVTAILSAGQHGYFKNSGEVETAEIPLGKITAATFTPETNKKITPTITVSQNSGTDIYFDDSATKTGYKSFAVKAKSSGENTNDISVTAGYVDTNVAINNKISAKLVIDETEQNKYVHIKNANFTNSNLTVEKSENSSLSVELNTTETAYDVTISSITVNAALAQDNAGYSTSGTGNLTKENVLLGSIKKGSVGSSVSSISAVINTSHEVGEGENKKNISINVETDTPAKTLEAGKDYFVISAIATATSETHLSDGYIEDVTYSANNTNESKSSETTYYIPSAKFKFVKDSTSATTFIECHEGGYISTGILPFVGVVTPEGGDSSEYIDEIDAAAITTQITATTGIVQSKTLTENLPSGAYELSFSANDINPGYISSSQGSISLDKKYYIPKGAVTSKIVDNTLTASVGKDTNKVSTSATATPYEIKLTPSAQVKTETQVTAGYVASSEKYVDSNPASYTAATPESIYIAAAVFEAVDEDEGSDIEITATATGINTINTVDSGGLEIKADGYKKLKIKESGHTVKKGDSIVAIEDTKTIRIKTNENPSGSLTGTPAVTFKEDGSYATIFNKVTGEDNEISVVSTPGSYGTSITTTATDASTFSGTNAAYSFGTYTGTYQGSTSLSGSDVYSTMTGSNVDEYVLALYSRIEGIGFDASNIKDDNGNVIPSNSSN